MTLAVATAAGEEVDVSMSKNVAEDVEEEVENKSITRLRMLWIRQRRI